MFYYNISFNIEFSEFDFWLQWVNQKFIPMMLLLNYSAIPIYSRFVLMKPIFLFIHFKFPVSSFADFDKFRKDYEENIKSQVRTFGSNVFCVTSLIEKSTIKHHNGSKKR